MSKKNYYAIRKGIKSNVIVESWADCELLVKGYAGAIFKGFQNTTAAQQFLDRKSPKWDKAKVKPANENKQGYVNTRDYEAVEYLGTFIPATDKKDKYGAYKPAYYMKNGVRHANYGRTIGENYVPYAGDSSVNPF